MSSKRCGKSWIRLWSDGLRRRKNWKDSRQRPDHRGGGDRDIESTRRGRADASDELAVTSVLSHEWLTVNYSEPLSTHDSQSSLKTCIRCKRAGAPRHPPY